MSVSKDAFSTAHEKLRADTSIQFDFPPRSPPTPPPEWLKELIEFLSSVGPLLKVLFWAAVGIGGALLVFMLIRKIVAIPRVPKTEAAIHTQDTDWRPEAAPARQLLQDADALAAAGRFDEAVHILLVRSIDDIEARKPKFIRPALTSRDIAAAETLPVGARRTFGLIAQIVETSLFGKRSIGSEAWQAARSAYTTFAFGGSWA